MRSGATLVIGYGSDLRGDDAAGQRAAEQVGLLKLPGVEVLAVHQLTPELAEPLAAADCVVFLDARLDAADSGALVRRLHPASPTPKFAHTCDPQGLLALAQTAFGRAPEAWWVTIPAAAFALGAPLSPLAACGVADAVTAVRRLLSRTSVADAAWASSAHPHGATAGVDPESP